MMVKGYCQSTHLHADDDDKGRRRSYCESLIVCEGNAVALRGVGQNSIWDEEQNHRGVDSLCDADEELAFIKQQVQLTGFIQLWILKAPLLRNILREMRIE